jgi:methyltransferase-like protein
MGVDPFWFPKISEVVRATSTLLEDSIQTGIYLKNLTEKNHIRIRLKIKTIKFLCFMAMSGFPQIIFIPLISISLPLEWLETYILSYYGYCL